MSGTSLAPRVPLVIGHRGSRGTRPENTLAAVDDALTADADLVEIDVQVTADGVPAVVHDPVLSGDLARAPGGARVAGDAPRVADLAWAELARFDIGAARPGSAVARAFPGQTPCPGARVPRLAEVVDRVAGSNAGLLVEIKSDPERPGPCTPPAKLAAAVLGEVPEQPAAPDVIYQSFDWRVLREILRLRPGARLSALTAEAPGAEAARTVYAGSPWLAGLGRATGAGELLDGAAALGCSIWAPFWGDLTRSRVAAARARGFAVFAWTINEIATARRLAGWGIDGIITDYPAALANALRQETAPGPTPRA
ncbi:glycerophosphodiester phosphodiesterase family protein [Roseovarius salinarum]|uniref:glycerophosphodiester phosphodiesterase family protein n=1 Tax=Roseovarius salinarum TaxID=1981892 RepID=UPI000C3479EE|nr:glycerophosphodiester phosphodiesterase family protein [Roseovarius salinarum]